MKMKNMTSLLIKIQSFTHLVLMKKLHKYNNFKKKRYWKIQLLNMVFEPGNLIGRIIRLIVDDNTSFIIY